MYSLDGGGKPLNQEWPNYRQFTFGSSRNRAHKVRSGQRKLKTSVLTFRQKTKRLNFQVSNVFHHLLYYKNCLKQCFSSSSFSSFFAYFFLNFVSTHTLQIENVSAQFTTLFLLLFYSISFLFSFLSTMNKIIYNFFYSVNETKGQWQKSGKR